MKYKLMPENKETKKAKDAKKLPCSFGKIVSVTTKVITNPDSVASGNAYGICALEIVFPSLLAKLSFFTKRVLLNVIIRSGKIIKLVQSVAEAKSFIPHWNSKTFPAANPKLIPNQNTKFHSLSLFSHLACTLGKFSATTSGFVKSCITRSSIRFKSFMYIIPKMVLLAKKFLAILAVKSVILLNNTVYAMDIETTDSKDYILNIIKLEEAKHSIPSGLLLALVKTESNLNPLALNINSKSLFFNDKEKAIKAINKSIASGVVSIDIGLAQINYRWHGENFTSVDSMLSPELNINYAAELLGKLKLTHGDWHKALRHYHSANSVHNQKYSRKVVMCWLGISENKPNKYR